MIVELVCPDGHKHTLLGPNITDEELKEYAKCSMPGCGKTMQRMGGTRPAASPVTDVQQF